jgi:hypothetical protein
LFGTEKGTKMWDDCVNIGGTIHCPLFEAFSTSHIGSYGKQSEIPTLLRHTICNINSKFYGMYGENTGTAVEMFCWLTSLSTTQRGVMVIV